MRLTINDLKMTGIYVDNVWEIVSSGGLEQRWPTSNS